MVMLEVNEQYVTEWRKRTPGHEGWKRVARPGAPNKFFMASMDCHVVEPPNLYVERIDEKFRHRLPRIEVDNKGVKWLVQEGLRPQRVVDFRLTGEDEERAKRGSANPEERLRDQQRDGVDAELIFATRGLFAFATNDPQFALAQARIFNDWAWEVFGPYNDRMSPAAIVPTADVDLAVAELERVAKMGYRAVMIPCKPLWGPGEAGEKNYNHPDYDRFWGALQDTGLPAVMHVGTGKDPRVATGPGGAVINYLVGALTPIAEPVANLCASGIFDRFPKLKFATIEAGISWIPFVCNKMDEAYLKHHMWVRPKLKMLPSEYFRQYFKCAYMEDSWGVDMAKRYGFIKNIMWSNDYPHHEGTWPHSAEAIERDMQGLTDEERALVLGLNAAEMFGFTVPEHQRNPR